LFDRLPRGVRLSAPGRALLEYARQMLGSLQQVREHVLRVERGDAGVLRIGHVARMRISPTGLDAIIPEFCVRYPDVDVQSVVMTVTEQCAALTEGRIDAGIAYAVPANLPGVRLELFELAPIDGVLLPSTHPLAKQEPLYCRDLTVLAFLRSQRSENPHG